jgi:hypothetical protein
MRKMNKNEIRNIVCPFCGSPIKGKVPKGLSLDLVMDLINKIQVVIKKDKSLIK